METKIWLTGLVSISLQYPDISINGLMYYMKSFLCKLAGKGSAYEDNAHRISGNFQKCVIIIDCFEVFTERPSLIILRCLQKDQLHSWPEHKLGQIIKNTIW